MLRVLLRFSFSPRVLMVGFIVSFILTSTVLYVQHVDTPIAVLAGFSFGFLTINAIIDAHTMKLFTLWTHCAGGIWLIACGLYAIAGTAQTAIWACVYAFLVFLIVRIISMYAPQSLGAGDARLFGVLVGWIALFNPVFIVAMFALASIIQLIVFAAWRTVYIHRYKKSHKDKQLSASYMSVTYGQQGVESSALPFGPALVFAGWVACLVAA